MYDIHFVNANIGYITGGYNYYHSPIYYKGIIYKTVDGGISWQVMDSSYSDGLVKMHFPSDSIGYATGMNGIILKITNANSTLSSVQTIHGLQNAINIYPNPLSSEITLAFQKQNIQKAKFIIRNCLGQTVLIKEENNLNNINSVKLELGFLSKGIYFLDINIDGEQTMRKIVKE